MINSRFFNRSELLGFLALAVLLFLILPLSLDIFRLNLVAKYLTYAFVGIGLVLCWGYGGILSLGQGVFFGLGGYCMAMYLKLEASSVANTKIQSTPGIPDFMDWNQLTSLPFFWKPFHSFPITLLAILLVPAFFALIIGAAMFKRRVGGVYFAIITQAIASDEEWKSLLALWGRRLVGDTLLIARGALRPQTLDAAEERKVEPVFTDLLGAHSRRMAAMALDA